MGLLGAAALLTMRKVYHLILRALRTERVSKDEAPIAKRLPPAGRDAAVHREDHA
jgi:hypothetical protein